MGQEWFCGAESACRCSQRVDGGCWLVNLLLPGPVSTWRRLVATAQNGLEVLRLGGLETGALPSEFDVVERCAMYRLRRYPAAVRNDSAPAVLLVPPMMLDAGVFDVTRDKGAVGVLLEHGIDPWVVDFGAPDQEEGGLERTLADHVVALSQAVDQVRAQTGHDVHLAGYSQGGMFCYQVAAYRRSEGIASVITLGSPVDVLGALPFGIPAEIVSRGAELLADHVFDRVSLPGWAARLGFELLDPVKTVRSRLAFIRALHDREALLPREEQRRFLELDGWVAWSGPAVAELFRQFVVHNRMMTGGFVIQDSVVSLAEITGPVLAVIGEVDDIGQPAAVRGVAIAAPRAEVYEMSVRAGHFGLVVGSAAARTSWPGIAGWLQWCDGVGELPAQIDRMSSVQAGQVETSPVVRVVHGAASAAAVGASAVRGVTRASLGAGTTGMAIAGEAARTLPRLARLGRVTAGTTVSLGLVLAEQGRRDPAGGCFVFDDRVHSNGAVNERVDNVVRGLIEAGVRCGQHVGVLMETRPSALVTIAALSRLGAVAVLLAPGGDLAEELRLGSAEAVVADPVHVAAATTTGARVLVLGGGSRDVVDGYPGVLDLERTDPAAVRLPAWYRPDAAKGGELAFIFFSRSRGRVAAKYVTNQRWALSAFGTASAAALDRGDTVLCPTPLHHPAALLTAVGGAVAAGSRIALTRSFEADRFAAEVMRYGVTVVSYTWNLLHEVTDGPGAELPAHHPIRLFIGSGMPPALADRVTARFAPARVVEFYAATETNLVLANLGTGRAGSKGRPLPGSATVRLAAYDTMSSRLQLDTRGLAVRCRTDEVGLLLSEVTHETAGHRGVLRGVFAAGDAWTATDDLFRCDRDGNFFLVDNCHDVVVTDAGPVFTLPISEALAALAAVDLAVAYGVTVDGRTRAVAAVSLLAHGAPTAREVTGAMSAIPVDRCPDVVHVVETLPTTSGHRPDVTTLRASGMPASGPTTWVLDRDSGTYRATEAPVQI